MKRKPSGPSSSSSGYPYKTGGSGNSGSSSSTSNASPAASSSVRTPNSAALLSQLDHLDALMAAQKGAPKGAGKVSAGNANTRNNSRYQAVRSNRVNTDSSNNNGPSDDMDRIVQGVSTKLSISSNAASAKISSVNVLVKSAPKSSSFSSVKNFVRPVFSNSSDEVELSPTEWYSHQQAEEIQDVEEESSFEDTDETEYFDSRAGATSYDEGEFEINHRQERASATKQANQNDRETNSSILAERYAGPGVAKTVARYSPSQLPKYEAATSDDHSTEAEYESTEEDASSIEQDSASSDEDESSGGDEKESKMPQHAQKVHQVLTHKSEEEASESAEDYSDDEDEGEDGYKPGGYHPVKLGEIYNQRYVVIKKLGWGHFSTVWMVLDRRPEKPVTQWSSDPRYETSFHYVALKVQKSAEHYTEAALDEVELLDSIAQERRSAENLLANNQFQKQPKDSDGVPITTNLLNSQHVATFKDSFFHSGPNGKHMCMVFNMLGCNLLSVIKAFSYQGIPIPIVKKIIKGVCMGLDFLHRKCKIIHTDLKPENVLLQFANPDRAAKSPVNAKADALDESSDVSDGADSVTSAISELEATMRDPRVSAPEKSKARQRLSQLKRQEATNHDGWADQRSTTMPLSPQTFLSDSQMDEIVRSDGGSSGRQSQDSSSNGALPSYVSKQLPKSRFISQNFSVQQEAVLTPWENAFKELANVSSPSKSEVSSYLDGNGVGFAEVSFVLRAFVTEGELADNVSAALGVRYERNFEGGVMRTWRCGISMNRSAVPQKASKPNHVPPMPPPSCATMFEILQQSRKSLSTSERKAREELVNLVSANFSAEGGPKGSYSGSNSTSCPPYSLFTVRFSVLSSVVVLAFLESRLPGLTFLAYKRDEGSPRIDPIVFGEFDEKICRHPLAMKLKNTQHIDGDIPDCQNIVASALIGIDLRMVKSFAARPTPGGDGVASFELTGQSMDVVRGWWSARRSLLSRVRFFMGIDPIQDLPPLLTDEESGSTCSKNESNIESPSKLNEPSEARISNAEDAMAYTTNPDLKDTNILLNSRAVIVDLGNACWTHRHFSEDIQTRQYRAPEVLIGSKYDTSSDMWSLGCMVFELLTGDLLFDPRSGDDYDRDEDHLAMFQELLGKIPKKIALGGKHSKRFFTKKGDLIHIKQLKYWPIDEVLYEKYRFPRKEAQEIAKFMLPLLEFNPKKRATALEMLSSPWLQDTT